MWSPMCRQRNINCVQQPECVNNGTPKPSAMCIPRLQRRGKASFVVSYVKAFKIRPTLHHSKYVPSKLRRISLSDSFIFLCCYFPQFNDHDFGGLSGGRIVRIATHPDFQGVSWMVRTFRRLFYPILLCNAYWNTLHMTWLFWTSSPGSSVSSKWDEVGLVTRLRLILLVTCAFIMNSIAFTVSQMPFSCIDRTKCREYVVSFSMWQVE